MISLASGGNSSSPKAAALPALVFLLIMLVSGAALGQLDSDGDGLTNIEEGVAGTDSLDVDTDDDGVFDGTEVSWNLDTDLDGDINALDTDSDNDGLDDGEEVNGLGTSMVNDDTDGDLLGDYYEVHVSSTNPVTRSALNPSK